MTMTPTEVLKEVCDRARLSPAYKPVVDAAGNVVTTYCNLAVRTVAHDLGYNLPSLMANSMADWFQVNWVVVDGITATTLALKGHLVIAAWRNPVAGQHGHVAVIYPQAMDFSPSLNKRVPIISNVGKFNDVVRITKAFPVKYGEPRYYTAPELPKVNS